MKEPLQGFQWDVFPAEWKDWLDEKGRPVVVPATAFKSPAAVELAWKLNEEVGPVLGKVLDAGSSRTIEPMSDEHVTLFKKFADLDYADRDEILAFATTYGGLRRSPRHQHQAKAKGRSGAHYANGESHLTWAVEIVRMREALKLSVHRTADQELRFREAWPTQAHRRAGLKPPYEKDKARLASLINSHISDVQPHIELGSLKRLSFAPTDLLSAMWVNFALAYVGDKSYRQCKQCQKLFELSPEEGFRSHRVFCDDPYCKTKDYRKRKRTALKLSALKTPLREIARQAGTDPKTVRRWVKEAKQRKS